MTRLSVATAVDRDAPVLGQEAVDRLKKWIE